MLGAAVVLALSPSVAAFSPALPLIAPQPQHLACCATTRAGGNSSIPPPMGTLSDPPSYDEQIGMTFTQSFTSLAYNVTAVEQVESTSGYGPAYLLNGLSDTGYWYQVGLSYNWDGTGTYSNYSPGFNLNYEVFDSSGNSIYPTNGGGGTQRFSGPVRAGDTVLLNLYFSSTYGVVMFAKDYDTGATASLTYSSEGGSEFIGLSSNTANSNGFFTGLMTEWYHSSPFYGDVSTVKYTNPHFALTLAWMWIDEFNCLDANCTNTTSLFSDATSAPISYSDPTPLHEFSSNGATEFSNAYGLITGPAYLSMTLSYSVAGGGTGYGQPSFRYTYYGTIQNATLTQFPETYTADAGSSWSVSRSLPGSSQSERWATTDVTSGTASSSQTVAFVYQHQYLLSVTGGSAEPGSSWYDSGSSAVVSSLGVFDRAGGSGQRVASYSIDGASTEVSPTRGSVSLTVLMDSPHEVAFGLVRQYALSTPTGVVSSVSSPSIPGDTGWYDVGSAVTVQYEHAWDIAAQRSRTVATGYSVNGGNVISVSVLGNGTFEVALNMNSHLTVSIESVTQYHFAFAIANSSGSGAVTSARIEIQVGNQTQAVNGLGAWLDSGSNFTIPDVTYEGANVAPSPQTRYSATGPENITLDALVYDATVKVTDPLGLPVGGAQVEMTLANGTVLAGATDGNGAFVASDIPLGTFTAKVTNLGMSTKVAGDASKGVVIRTKVLLSMALVALAAVLATVIVVSALAIRRRSKRHPRQVRAESPEESIPPAEPDQPPAGVA